MLLWEYKICIFYVFFFFKLKEFRVDSLYFKYMYFVYVYEINMKVFWKYIYVEKLFKFIYMFWLFDWLNKWGG